MRSSRAQLALALAICAALVVGSPVAAAAAAPLSPFTRSVDRLENALRIAIEVQPEGLLKSLAASERVCELGQRAEERGEGAAAAANWSTLGQAVTQLDEPGPQVVERALDRAHRQLGTPEATFGRAWRGKPARLRPLHEGAAAVRRGIDSVTASVENLRTAFSAWGAHRCESALAAIATTDQEIPAGVDTLSHGMLRLWLIS